MRVPCAKTLTTVAHLLRKRWISRPSSATFEWEPGGTLSTTKIGWMALFHGTTRRVNPNCTTQHNQWPGPHAAGLSAPLFEAERKPPQQIAGSNSN
jgi:hypothetical protein